MKQETTAKQSYAVHAKVAAGGAQLFGFAAAGGDEPAPSKRGGFGGNRGNQGGGRAKKFATTDEDFPAL